MSIGYDEYLIDHRNNVAKGFQWLKENLPDIIGKDERGEMEWQICVNHDASKNHPEEYNAYDRYFYGSGNHRSYEVVKEFNLAWLHHIHHNPHHWQHWVLINDNPDEGEIVMDMPYIYIVEMVCDWWAFSWKKGNLNEIFGWYDEHKAYMKLSTKTRKTVEDILAKIKEKI
jgi:hypothetical protein